MERVVGIGLQDFSKIQKEKVFYIDKTKFIMLRMRIHRINTKS